MNLLLFKESEGGDTLPVLPRIRPSISTSESPSGYWQRLRARIIQGYENLKERLSHEERVCSNLRRVDSLVVHHSGALSGEQAQKKLRNFLKFGYSKHRAWFWIDSILALLGVALFWVPGPNVFFLYPAARALSHYFAQNGARRALSVPWSYQVEPLIDRIEQGAIENSDFGPAIETLEQRYDIENLQNQLRTLKTG